MHHVAQVALFVYRCVFVCLKYAVKSSLLKYRKCNISVWQRFLFHVFPTCTWSQLVARFLLIAQLYRLLFFSIMICCVYTRSNKQIICLKYHLHAKKPNKKRNPQRGKNAPVSIIQSTSCLLEASLVAFAFD